MRSPTITAEHEDGTVEVVTADGRRLGVRPYVYVTTTFEHGKHEEALAALRAAVADVEEQIAEVSR